MPTKFSRRHYTAIANVLRTAQSDPDTTLFTPIEVLRVADLMSRAFAKDNSRFDRDRFLLACGVLSRTPFADVTRAIRYDDTIAEAHREGRKRFAERESAKEI